ncbi:hypothetical protein [Paractinoplanes toevensis]|uniref:hypothetical protein n=1 Tax=Paractinoplanes toevensis TaxID=571911 RepID=UPI001BB3FD98|nr:hypothetical protein [Actinoplanes toevensis]
MAAQHLISDLNKPTPCSSENSRGQSFGTSGYTESDSTARKPRVPIAGRPGRPRRRFATLLADKAYSSAAFRQTCRERGTEPIIPKPKTTGIKGLGKLRYVVEQTFALLHPFRRLAVRGERRLDIHDGFVSLACVLICRRRLINWTEQRSCQQLFRMGAAASSAAVETLAVTPPGVDLLACRCCDERMLMTTYAEQLAGRDTGWWRAAVRQAATWISPQRPAIDLSRQIPISQTTLQATALLVYGLTRSRLADPRSLHASEVLDWVTAHQLPTPPEPEQVSNDDLAVALRRWRTELDHAIARQQHDIADLLRAAGHDVPQPGLRGLDRNSPDPVVMTWLTLVDTDGPDVEQRTMFDRYPTPMLSLGLTSLIDTIS